MYIEGIQSLQQNVSVYINVWFTCCKVSEKQWQVTTCLIANKDLEHYN